MGLRSKPAPPPCVFFIHAQNLLDNEEKSVLSRKEDHIQVQYMVLAVSFSILSF
jgi:hypothetical protein